MGFAQQARRRPPAWALVALSLAPTWTLSAQDGSLFPDFLIDVDAEAKDAPAGTFVRNSQDFILCRGKNFQGEPAPGTVEFKWGNDVIKNIGAWNNSIVEEIAKSRERDDLLAAQKKLEAGLKADPQFFPLLFNLGRVLLFLNLPEPSIRYLLRAKGVLPAFSGTYLQLGNAYSRSGDDRAAVYNYREASRRNRFDLAPIVALGNFYLSRKDSTQARYYYSKVLEALPQHSGARIGMGRIFMEKNDTTKARSLLKSIVTENFDGTERTDYDRSLHYYLALLDTEAREYAEAVREYDRLLKHPEDPFFLENSYKDIKKRREIAKRLAEATGSSLEK